MDTLEPADAAIVEGLRLVFLRTLSCAILLALSIQCAKTQSAPNASDSPDAGATKGANKLGVVNFPDWFLRKKTPARNEDIIIATGDYQVRQSEPTGELLFEAIDNDGESSANFFGASLDGQLRVRAVSAVEWAQAQPLPSTRFDQFSKEIQTADDGAQYRGKTYAKTGQSWETTTALLSLTGEWLAVFSHTSEKGKPSYGVLGGGGRGEGEMFIDVYKTSSGKKVLFGKARHGGGSSPGRLFDKAFWVGDRYLIVPRDSQGEGPSPDFGSSCFLWILPAP